MNSGNHSGTTDSTGEIAPGQTGGVAGWWGRWLQRVPAGVWARVLFIFLALCLIKCGVIFSLRKELFQTHWRIGNESFSGANYLAFGALALLLGVQLWLFGQRCAVQGVKAVRWGFAVLMVLAAAFIALSFYEGNRSYLAAVVNGVLNVGDLKSYLMLNTFFRAPYLAVWIGFVAGIYYVAVRTGRESRMIQVLAVLAPVYLVVNLNDLIRFQSQLWVLVALGLAALAAGFRLQRGLRWSLALLPWALMSVMFLLFGGRELLIASPKPEFQILLAGVAVLFLGGTLVAWRQGFYGAWSVMLPFLSVSFLVLATDKFLMSGNYRNLLVTGLGLPRYFVGEFLLAAALLVGARLYLRWRQAGSLLWLDVAGLLVVMLALLDFRLSQIMGVRMDWQVMSAADLNSPTMLWRMAAPYLPMVMAAMAVGVAIYVAVLRWLGRCRPAALLNQMPASTSWRYGVTVLCFLAVLGMALVQPDKAQGQALTSLVSSASWWRNLSQAKLSPDAFLSNVRDLGLDTMLVPPAPPQRARRDLNVVVIFQESFFNKHLSLFGSTNETQPLLSRHRDRMELFPNFHSSFAGSINARFATFTGLYPVREYRDFTRTQVPVKSLFEILNEQGYECSMFYSSFYDYTNFRDFLRGRGLAKMYDADTMPGNGKPQRVAWGLKEEETLGAIQQQLRDYGRSGEKFFLTYVPACPHYPFDGIPKRFEQFPKGRHDDLTPRYLNELLYMDWVIDEILQELNASGLLENTLVVITSDHGELTGAQDGIIGHGWKLDPELTNVPLIILDPAKRGYRVNPVAGSQVDLLPTIVDLLGLPLPADQLYQGVSLYSAAAAEPRNIYLNSHRQFAVLRQDQIVFGDREKDEHSSEGVYGLTKAGDFFGFAPVETNAPMPDIVRFDKFQENLLRHYDYYTRLFRSPAPGSVSVAASRE